MIPRKVHRDLHGFCRNLYAMRPLGIASALLGLVASIGAGYWSLKMGKLDYLPLGCAAVCGGLLLLSIYVVTAEWVKVPALNYAQHLLESTEKILQRKK